MVKLEVSQEKYINRLTIKTNHSPATALPPFKDLLGGGLPTAGREAGEPGPQEPMKRAAAETSGRGAVQPAAGLRRENGRAVTRPTCVALSGRSHALAGLAGSR